MAFEELMKNKPTSEWKERMEDDDIFTDENIDEVNRVLDTYLNNLMNLGDQPSEKSVLLYVKEVVMALNELNDKYDSFIETMEREELCEFIIEASHVAGLKSEEDITEEWREW